MSIRQLSDLTGDIYQDAQGANAEHGLSYINLSAHLAQMSTKGDVSQDLVNVDPDSAPRGNDGRIVSPIRQMLVNSGARLSGLSAHSASIFMQGSPDYIKGSHVLFPALTQEIFEDALGLRAEEGFTSRPASRTDDVYMQPTRPGVVDERLGLPARMVTLGDLLSARAGIDGDSYRALTIREDARDPNEYVYSRVAERGTFPTFIIALGERAIRIFKYGAAVEASYESLRRMRFNLLEITLAEIAFGENIRRILEALETLLNGDGNSNPALDTPIANAYTVQILDEFLLDASYNRLRDITLAIGDLAEVKAIRALRYPRTNIQLTPDELAMYGNEYALPDGTPLRVAPKGSVLDGSRKLLGLVSGRGLIEVVENGSQIQETMRFIENQTQKWTMSVNLGYEKLYRDSAQTATRAA